MTQEIQPVKFKLLKPAVNQTVYLKAGIMGFAGSGKTFTASELALGLSKKIGDKKPVAFFDTETGSDYMIPKFKVGGVELMVIKSRAFLDLLAVIKEAEQGCSVLVIDSITHVWKDLTASYLKRTGKRKLGFPDWNSIKEEWGQFTDAYLNSRIHIILCGRAGYEYAFEKDEDGKNELIKTGTKMKAEGEFGYEPSFSIEMERVKRSVFLDDDTATGFVHKATILKDRSQKINGSVFFFDPQDKKCPSPFQSFKPAIDFLNIGGEHLGIDTSRNSENLFEDPDYSWSQRKRQVEIVLENIQAELILQGFDGSSAETKKKRTELLMEIFGTYSKTEIDNKSLESLQAGFEKLRAKRLPPPLSVVDDDIDDSFITDLASNE